MKNTTNAFLGAMSLDYHPLSTPQTVLTDALNATFITHNGNELLLQNDMGNALILDTATGQMMQLREGFVPVGMKEHGGILYIVSADKEGNGEIGTIPSPIITWDFADATGAINDYLIAEGKDIYNICQVSTKLHPGEQYALILNLDSGIWDDTKGYFTCPNLGYYDPVLTLSSKTTVWVKDGSPIISTVNLKGYYTLNLYGCNDYNNYLITDTTAQQYYRRDQDDIKNSNFWFIPSLALCDSTGNFHPLNEKYMSIDNCFKKYPGTVPAGKLAVKAALENIGRFELVKRAGSLINPSLGESYLPYTMTVKDGDTEMYYTYFSSFRYKSDSSVRVNRLKVKIIKKADLEEEIPIYRYVAGGHLKITDGILNCAPEKEIDIVDKKEKYDLTNNLVDTNKDISYDFYTFKYDNWYYLQRKVYSTEPENNGFKSFDAGKVSSDRHGLFYIKSSEYNVWYIMQVEYYDLCDRLLGTYEVEFNPFYNDYIGDGSDEIEVDEKRKLDNFKKVEKTDEFVGLSLDTLNFKYYDNLQDIKDNYEESKRIADYATFDLKLSESPLPKTSVKPFEYLYTNLSKYTEEYLLTNCVVDPSRGDGMGMIFPFAFYGSYEMYTNKEGSLIPLACRVKVVMQANDQLINTLTSLDSSFLWAGFNDAVGKKYRFSELYDKGKDFDYTSEPMLAYYNNNPNRRIYGCNLKYLDSTLSKEALLTSKTLRMKGFSSILKCKISVKVIAKLTDKEMAWKCRLGHQPSLSAFDDYSLLYLKSDGEIKFTFNSSTYKIIPQINHYYKYTDKDTAEVIKIPGNLKETSIYKTTLWLDENNKPYNFVNIEEVLDDNNIEVGIQKTSDIRGQKLKCPNHSINLDIWAEKALSTSSSIPLAKYEVTSFQSLSPGTYVINFYGYDVNYDPTNTNPMTIRLRLGDLTIDLTSGQPVVIKLDHTVSKSDIEFVDISTKSLSGIRPCYAFTDFGIYLTDNVESMPANQAFPVSDYKEQVIMPLAETFVENNIVCGDTTFNYEYSPKYAYETNIDMDGKICQYTVKKGVYETYENVASPIIDTEHTSHLDKNNPPIIRFTNE